MDDDNILKKTWNGVSNITLGDIVTYAVPTGTMLTLLWFFMEPVLAGQIEKAFDKYGVSKGTFTEMSEQVVELKKSNEELKGTIGSLKSQQTVTQSQNRQILKAFEQLQMQLPPAQ